MKNRRVIVIQDLFMHYRIGFFSYLSRLLVERNYELVVLTSNYDRSLISGKKMNSFEVILLGTIRPMFKKKLFWQSNLLEYPVSSSDIIVIPGNIRFLSYILFFIKCRFAGACVGFWSHYWSRSKSNCLSSVRFLLYRFADFLLFYTKKEVAYGKKNNFIKNRKLIGLNNGLDYDSIKPFVVGYDANLRPKKILFSGRLTVKSYCYGLLEAVALMKDRTVVLEIIGDGPELKKLKQLSINLGIEHRVSFQGEIFDESILSASFNSAMLFVYPGNVGLSLMHAFSYGIPVVIPKMKRIECMPEVDAFKNNINGRYFVNDSWSSLANEIDELIIQPYELNRLSTAAKETVKNNFNSKNMAFSFIKGLNLPPVSG